MNKTQVSLTFVGRPFADNLMAEQKNFNANILEMESDSIFQDFLKNLHLEDQRANLIVFGPSNFMYWYGVIANVEEIPQGLMKFSLPKAQVFEKTTLNKDRQFFSEPLDIVVSKFLQAASMSSKIYENIGDSPTPYILQELELSNKKLTQELYLRVNS